MSPLAVSGIVFAIVFVGALIGLFMRSRLPEHHLSADTKDVVKLTMALLSTLTALVLGLLIASAKGSFDAQRGGVSQLAANVGVLDRTLALYGPETKEIRGLLRDSIDDLIRRTWPEEQGPARHPTAGVGTEARYEDVYERILRLEPKTDAQRTLQAQALRIAIDTGHMRLNLAAQQRGSTIPTAFLVVMVLWLALILGSFALFTPGNPTAVGSLAVCALAVSSAVLLILELDHPYGGIIEVSGEPLRRALEQLGR
jgi:hypothetical protein